MKFEIGDIVEYTPALLPLRGRYRVLGPGEEADTVRLESLRDGGPNGWDYEKHLRIIEPLTLALLKANGKDTNE